MAAMNTITAPGPILGLTAAECTRASISNFARATAEDDQRELSFFRELTEQTSKATQRQPRGFNTYLVPGDVTAGTQRRDLTKGGSTGSYLVGTDIAGFSTALNAASLIGKLPMTVLPNLTGDAVINRESVKGTAGWLADEAAVAPDVQSSVGQISLSPKTISGSVVVTKQMLKQAGPVGAAVIERALATTVAEAGNRAIVAGSGNAGQPLGIANISGTDTRAGTTFTWTMAQAMAKVAAGWDSSESVAWIAGVDAAEDLKTRERASGSGFIVEGNQLDGRPFIVSRSIGAQVLVCMPWSQFWLASWGALELAADPMTYFRDGRVQLRCLWSVDFCVERAASVAIATALT
jgi:HK97 family phage major capsid protein